MSGHTPGPWRLTSDDRTVLAGQNEEIYVVATVKNPRDGRLIAAAPDMLEALRTIAYEPLGHPEAPASEILAACERIARTAIAKAEGGE